VQLEEVLCGAMNKAVGFSLWHVAEQHACEGLGTEFGAMLVRDVDKGT
jgi:hypothetical protein